MGKVVIMICLFGMFAFVQAGDVKCLDCHQKQQIPSSLVYKRYLMKYSTKARIQEAILSYLQNPQKERSIMPSAFFLKFPMKEKSKEDTLVLQEGIAAFLNRFDIQKRLINSQ